jgi:hypothetical protein
LGRHLFLPSLGRAFLYTGEEKYRKAYFETVDDWIQATPYGFGVHWASPLECTIRSISWLTTLQAFLPVPACYAFSFCNQVARMVQHVEHTMENLSVHLEYPNNHLIAQTAGILLVQLALPILFPQGEDVQEVETILWREIQRQVDSQGLHKELCPFYHQFVFHLLLLLRLFYSRIGREMPEGVLLKIERMAEASDMLLAPDGYLPYYIGDRATAKLESFFEPETSARDLLVISRALSLGEFPPDGFTEPVLWHLGASRTKNVSAYPRGYRSCVLRDSGWCISRCGFGADEWWLLFKAGVMGYGYAGHGHADALSVCARVGEQLVLSDPGTFTYSGPQEWRTYFRSTIAHNTVRVDGRDQAISRGVFDWERRVDARLIGAITDEGYDVFAAYHDAYAPVRHTRFVIVIHKRFWMVIDYLSGDVSSGHSWEISWHLAPCEVACEEGNRVVARFNGLCTIVDAKAQERFSRNIFTGCTDPIRGWFSPRYYVKVPSPTIVYSGEFKMPCWIASLIVPSRSDVDIQWEWTDNTACVHLDGEEYVFTLAEVGQGIYSITGSCQQRTLFTAQMGGEEGCGVS